MDIPKLYDWLYRYSMFQESYSPRMVNSLYFDTPNYDFASSNMSGESKRIKVRARWYGELDRNFLDTFLSESQEFTFEVKRKVNSVSDKLNIVFENYYQESLKLYPMMATSQGDIRYNDFLPNNLSDEFRNNEKVFYSNYKKLLNDFNDNKLNDQDLLSKKVLLWQCDRNLERLSFNEHFMPINQMWTLQLNIGQYAAGLSAQPFKTVKDYNDWLLRLDDYIIWLNSAENRMKEGIKIGYVLPK